MADKERIAAVVPYETAVSFDPGAWFRRYKWTVSTPWGVIAEGRSLTLGLAQRKQLRAAKKHALDRYKQRYPEATVRAKAIAKGQSDV
jgi:hypothetical protein